MNNTTLPSYRWLMPLIMIGMLATLLALLVWFIVRWVRRRNVAKSNS